MGNSVKFMTLANARDFVYEFISDFVYLTLKMFKLPSSLSAYSASSSFQTSIEPFISYFNPLKRKFPKSFPGSAYNIMVFFKSVLNRRKHHKTYIRTKDELKTSSLFEVG